LKIILTTFTLCIFLSIGLVPDVFSHGLGGEVLLKFHLGSKTMLIGGLKVQ